MYGQVAELSCQLGEHVTCSPPKGAKSVVRIFLFRFSVDDLDNHANDDNFCLNIITAFPDELRTTCSAVLQY